MGTPKRCAEPIATSAPSSPGEANSVSARRSAATIASAPLARRAQVAHGTRGRRILQQPAEYFGAIEISAGVADDQIPTQRLGAGAQHGQRLRVYLGIDEERFCFGMGRAFGQRHRLAAAVGSSSSEALATSSP